MVLLRDESLRGLFAATLLEAVNKFIVLNFLLFELLANGASQRVYLFIQQLLLLELLQRLYLQHLLLLK